MSLDDLLAKALAGDQRSLARVATILEDASEGATAIRRHLHGRDGSAHIVGITGPPGVGKSSLLANIATTLSAAGKSVAIVAVDPTSPLTGGATLGDRIRMSQASLSGNVFVRSLASRSRIDGLAPAALDIVHLFDAAGFAYVFLETVGSGQNQFEIARWVQTVVLVEAPGAGDSVQMLKAGIMELADIYAVTKSDLPGAHNVTRELRTMVSLNEEAEGVWQPHIILCSSETGEGISKLIQAIEEHAAHLAQWGKQEMRGLERARAELRNAVLEIVEHQLASRSEVVQEVAEGLITPEEAARSLIASISESRRSTP